MNVMTHKESSIHLKDMAGSAIIDGKTYSDFDNFEMNHPFEYEGKTWLSSEQLYNSMKFSNPNYKESIRLETNAFKVYEMGQNRSQTLASGFPESRVSMMYNANLAKFEQNPELWKSLVGTVGSITYPGNDAYWGTYGGNGENWNGKNLEKIREHLRTQ